MPGSDPKRWPRVVVDFSPKWSEADRESVAALLSGVGSLGWEEAETSDGARWTIYFPVQSAESEFAVRRAVARVADASDRSLSFECSGDELDDADWMAVHREYFKPFIASDRFAVAPPWFREEWPFPGRERLTIYPGMAFGTGTHETTRLMLQALEDIGCDGKRVLDVGVGSGILSIAAIRSGASKVVGHDIDDDALANARENLGLNDAADLIDLIHGGPGAVEGVFDLVVANMLYAHLQPLLPQIARKVAATDSARLVVAGFLVDEFDQVIADLAAYGLVVVDRGALGEWGRVVARRTNGEEGER